MRALCLSIKASLLYLVLTSTAANGEEKNFLDAINGEPYEDNLHLIFADWLEDNGRLPEAKFIRDSIEILQIRSLNREKPLSIADRERLAILEKSRDAQWARIVETWKSSKLATDTSFSSAGGKEAFTPIGKLEDKGVENPQRLAPRGLLSKNPEALDTEQPNGSIDRFLQEFRSAYGVVIAVGERTDAAAYSQWSRVRSLGIHAYYQQHLLKILELTNLKRILELNIQLNELHRDSDRHNIDGRALNGALKKPAFRELKSLAISFDGGSFINKASLFKGVKFRLETLSIASSQDRVSCSDALAILSSPAAQDIVALELKGVNWSDNDAPRLIKKIQNLAQLKKLFIRQFIANSEAALTRLTPLFSGSLRERLRELSLELFVPNDIVDQAYRSLSDHASKWTQLDYLELFSTGLPSENTIERFLNAQFPELTELYINYYGKHPKAITEDRVKKFHLPPRLYSLEIDRQRLAGKQLFVEGISDQEGLTTKPTNQRQCGKVEVWMKYLRDAVWTISGK